MVKHRYIYWTLLLVFMVARHTVMSNPVTLTPSQKDAIREVAESVLACRNVPGLTLTAVSSQDVLLLEGYGLADVASGRLVTPDTLFPIGSLTKAFATALLADVLNKDAPQFTWDTPLHEMLEDWFELYDSTLTDQTTLRDILSHRTGIPGYFVSLLAGLSSNATRAQIVRRMRYHRPTHEPRTHFIYNNFHYLLAGHVTEVLAEQTWESLLYERLLHPLEMTSSILVKDVNKTETRARLAMPYIYDGSQHVQVDLQTLHQVDLGEPAGALISSSRDMAKWLQLHLRQGQSSSGEQVVARTALRQTYEESMLESDKSRDILKPYFPIIDCRVAYDLGWITSVHRGYKRIWHSGGIATYKSLAWFFPEMDLGLFASVNGPPTPEASAALQMLLHFVSDLALGEEPWLNTTTACTFPRPWRKPRPKPPPSLRDLMTPRTSHALPNNQQDYVGVYKNPGFDDAIITFNESQNVLQFQMGNLLRALLLYNETLDTFFTKCVDIYWFNDDRMPMRFHRSETDGRIDILEMAMYTPYATAIPSRFIKGDKGNDNNGEEGGSHKNSCVNSLASSQVASMSDHTGSQKYSCTIIAAIFAIILFSK